MENFGILNFLSTLAGQTKKEEDKSPAQNSTGNSPQQVTVKGPFSSDKAMQDFLRRHDEISRRIDEKYKK